MSIWLDRKQAKLDKRTCKIMALELFDIFVQDKVSELIKDKFVKI